MNTTLIAVHRAVLEHMEVHGIERGDSWTKHSVDNFDPSECWDRAEGVR